MWHQASQRHAIQIAGGATCHLSSTDGIDKMNLAKNTEISWLVFLAAIAGSDWATYFFIRPLTTSAAIILDLGTLVACSLIAIPMFRFVSHGWEARFQEFRNRLNHSAMHAYLIQFWQLRLESFEKDNGGKSAPFESLFDTIYSEQYGRMAFVLPMVALLIVTYLQAVVVGLTLMGFKAGSSIGVLSYLSQPLGDQSLSAILGAYLFVVVDIVANVRKRSLNIFDIQLYALRIFLATAIATSIIGIMSSSEKCSASGAALAFALGAFPMDWVAKQFRRLTNKRFFESESDQEDDQLIKLEGVTVAVVAQMNAEGVHSTEQLIGIDPVLLSIRTGLPFKLILRLSSQAIVRRHLGSAAAKLVPLGLADAEPIAKLIATLDKERMPPPVAGDGQLPQQARAIAEETLKVATTVLSSDIKAATPTNNQDQLSLNAPVEFNFRQIAAEGYTKFLMQSPLDLGSQPA